MKSIARLFKWLSRLTLFIGLIGGRLAAANGLVVYNNNDNGAGSLRQAIHDASTNDSITFSNSVTGSITLLSGAITIDKSLTITGPGASVLTISGGGSNQIFIISSSTFYQNVALSGLTIANGWVTNDYCGAIYKDLPFGSLTFSDCIFTNNSAERGAGAIYSLNGLLMLSGCTFVSNTAYAPLFGSSGGAIINVNFAAAVNCTFVGNYAAFGGAIENSSGGQFALTNCTLINNSARSQGGGLNSDGQTTLQNTIIAGNACPNGPDYFGTVISAGYNLIGDGTGSSGFNLVGDQVGSGANPINPLLGPLQDNGGPTPTVLPQPNSPAIDQGGNGGLSLDQRGQPRPFDQPSVPNAVAGDGSDIGAVEAGEFLAVLNLNDHGPGSLRQAVLNADQGAGNLVSFAPGLSGVIILNTGEIPITTNLTIFGPAAKILTVSGNNAGRVFNINGGKAGISGLTLTGGAVNDACVRVFPGSGLALNSCLVVSNSCAGIFNEGILTVINSTVAYNTNNSSFGGGIAQWGGTAALTNCTVSGNSARVGGGIYFATVGSLTVDHCTVVSNLAAPGTIPSRFGGGLANFTTGVPGGQRIFIRNTLVAGNTASSAGPDVDGAFTSSGYNLISRSDASTGLTNGLNHDLVGTIAVPTNAFVGPLQDNGGPGPTHGLLLNSPAVDAGNSFGLATDERGAPRPFDFATAANAGDGGDIGAFELGGPRLSIFSAATNVVITWPAFYGGFSVQSTTNLELPNGWSNLPGIPAIVGNQYTFTNQVSGTLKAYRLQSE